MTHPAASDWPLIAGLQQWEARLAGKLAGRGRFGVALYEFLRFGAKQAWACLFGGLMRAAAGYALVVSCGRAAGALRLPDAGRAGHPGRAVAAAHGDRAEAKVILMFHAVGTVMEIFKTRPAPGSIPRPICCASAACRCSPASCTRRWAATWRGSGGCSISARAHPPLAATLALSALIYANFFAHHFIADFRLLLFALTALLFGRAWVYFRIWREYRRMPLLLGFVLVALFIWFAENIGTFANAWRYPNQSGGWEMVSIAAGLLVPADDHQLCDGQRGEPPRGHLGRPCCRNAARGRGIGRIWRVPYFLSRSGLRLAGQ